MTFDPDKNLPGCMMPDGGECCASYAELYADWKRLNCLAATPLTASEEAIELAHAEGMERDVFNRIADRVYSRPAGDTPKEIGQAQACLETFAENIGLSSDGEAQREWERVQNIPADEWGRRHAAKVAVGIATAVTRAHQIPTTSQGD